MDRICGFICLSCNRSHPDGRVSTPDTNSCGGGPDLSPGETSRSLSMKDGDIEPCPIGSSPPPLTCALTPSTIPHEPELEPPPASPLLIRGACGSVALLHLLKINCTIMKSGNYPEKKDHLYKEPLPNPWVSIAVPTSVSHWQSCRAAASRFHGRSVSQTSLEETTLYAGSSCETGTLNGIHRRCASGSGMGVSPRMPGCRLRDPRFRKGTPVASLQTYPRKSEVSPFGQLSTQSRLPHPKTRFQREFTSAVDPGCSWVGSHDQSKLASKI